MWGAHSTGLEQESAVGGRPGNQNERDFEAVTLSAGCGNRPRPWADLAQLGKELSPPRPSARPAATGTSVRHPRDPGWEGLARGGLAVMQPQAHIVLITVASARRTTLLGGVNLIATSAVPKPAWRAPTRGTVLCSFFLLLDLLG